MWDKEVIYVKSDLYFNDLMQSIEQAQKSIFLEFYIFEFDTIGKKLLALLEQAATRRVEVKLLLDGFGASNWTFSIAESFRSKGLEISFFHPLAWQVKPSLFWKNLGLQKMALGYYKFNHRNHRKICIIDGKTLFIGSCNVIDYHLQSLVGEYAWRDTCAKLEGPEVNNFIENFMEVWELTQKYQEVKWIKKIKKQKRINHLKIIQKIRSAKKRIWITNPYFVPDFQFLKALCYASRNGVDVKILLPNKVNVVFLKYAAQAFYTLLTTFGVKIYEYNVSMLHAKVLIIDDWTNIGSSNLDFRSIYYNLECNAQVSKPESINFLKEQFYNDIKIADKINLIKWRNRSWLVRFLERFFLLFRNIL